eukprot:1185844-Prorocentrum_minimum.AAC.2
MYISTPPQPLPPRSPGHERRQKADTAGTVPLLCLLERGPASRVFGSHLRPCPQQQLENLQVPPPCGHHRGRHSVAALNHQIDPSAGIDGLQELRGHARVAPPRRQVQGGVALPIGRPQQPGQCILS